MYSSEGSGPGVDVALLQLGFPVIEPARRADRWRQSLPDDQIRYELRLEWGEAPDIVLSPSSWPTGKSLHISGHSMGLCSRGATAAQ